MVIRGGDDFCQEFKLILCGQKCLQKKCTEKICADARQNNPPLIERVGRAKGPWTKRPASSKLAKE